MVSVMVSATRIRRELWVCLSAGPLVILAREDALEQ